MLDINSINTPGEYYAIGYALAIALTIICSKKKHTTFFSLHYFMLYAVTTLFVMHTYPAGNLAFFIITVFNHIWMYFAIFINCDYPKKVCLYLTINAFLLGEFIASSEWMVYYFARKRFHYPANRVANILMLIIIDGFILLIYWLLERQLGRDIGKLELKKRDVFTAFLISITIYFTSNIYYLAGKALFGGIYASELFVIRTLVDLGGVAILYAFKFQLGDVSARLERDRLQDALVMQQANYEILEQAMELVNIKYHDLKHQIALFREGMDNQKTTEYLDRMEQEIKIYEVQNKTGNKVLDTILTAKSIYCQSHWIEMTVVAEGAALSFMEDMDISALFGNLIDNAIESVDKIEQKERKLIHLAVAKQKGFVRIRLENCYDKKPIIVNGRIKTSKEDKRYHGYGLKSIEAIVKKYGGSMVIQAEDGWFEQRILIPVVERG